MIYHLPLHTVGLVVAIILILIGLPGVIVPEKTQKIARIVPRSFPVGVIILAIDLIWTVWLVATMEMGEFQTFRKPLLALLPIGFLLTLRFVDEFLAVRALGILCLLAAEPLLDAAFLRNDAARLLVTTFAYILVVLGILWVTMPYLLRDQVSWSARSLWRWRGVHLVCLLYGVAVLCLSLVYY